MFFLVVLQQWHEKPPPRFPATGFGMVTPAALPLPMPVITPSVGMGSGSPPATNASMSICASLAMALALASDATTPPPTVLERDPLRAPAAASGRVTTMALRAP